MNERGDPRRVLTLGEVADRIDYGYTASSSDAPVGPRFLRITDIVSGLDWKGVPFCKIDTEDVSKYLLEHGDLVIARTGATVGATAYIQNPPEAVFASYLVRLRVSPEHDARYVYYVTRSAEWVHFIDSIASGKSAQPNASASAMAEFTFAVPPLAEQRAIAGVLGALDDKIESNRRVIDLAGMLARVEFRNIRDQGSGRLRRLGEMVQLRYGKALPEGARRVGGFPVYGSAGVTGWHDEALVSGPVVLLGRKGRPGTTYLSFEDCWPIDTTFWLDPQEPISLAWLYLAVEELDLGRFGADSAVPGLNREMAEADELRAPDEPIMQTFQECVWPLLELIRQNELECSLLATLRDSLLPELLSGRLRVRDAESVLEEVL